MSRVIITRELECKSCNKKKNDYNSSEVVHDHLICKSCGKEIRVVVNLDEIDNDYKSVNGTTERKIPKVKMSKKQRRKLKRSLTPVNYRQALGRTKRNTKPHL